MTLFQTPIAIVSATVLCVSVASAEDRQTLALDLRVEASSDALQARDGTNSTSSDTQTRLGVGYDWELNEKWNFVAHASGRYSSSTSTSNALSGVLPSLSNSEGLNPGDSTVDNFYFSYRREEGKQIRMGRVQLDVSLPGVNGRSLSRHDTRATQINWSDGFHFSFKDAKGWQNQVLIAYTPSSGPTSVQRSPLNFSASSTRYSYFFASDKREEDRTWYLSGFTFTYLPNALCRDGVSSCTNRSDYLAYVMRQGWQWPFSDTAGKILLGVEAGFSPHTPAESVLDLPGTGTASGLAWQVALDVKDFAPGHSVGIASGLAEGGWLVSPSYNNNTALTEIRYHWAFSPKQSLSYTFIREGDIKKPLSASRPRQDTRSVVRYDWKW